MKKENPYQIIYDLKKEIERLKVRHEQQINSYKSEIAKLKHEILHPHIQYEQRELIENKVINAICDYFNVTPAEVVSTSRHPHCVLPRHFIAYTLRKNFLFTYRQIGILLGHRDHSTIVHATTAIDNYLGYDKQIQRQYEDIKRILYTICNDGDLPKYHYSGISNGVGLLSEEI